MRKGKNEQGADTYYVQAARSRSTALAAGYPQKAEDLFQYDALVLANVEGTQLGRAQLEATRDFVGRRGGGLLVLGAHSFLRRGLIDTALEEVLPLELAGRGRGVVPAVGARGMNRVALTPAGEMHPVMQLGAATDDTRKRWDATPALASIVPLGDPRPGASVLAVTTGAGGVPSSLVAVQRYGNGRSMIFAGEAAWRWRMMMPASDRSYDTFWRQAVRWLAIAAQDPLNITAPAGAATGDALTLRISARSPTFDPLTDVSVDVRITAPDGRLQQVRAAADTGARCRRPISGPISSRAGWRSPRRRRGTSRPAGNRNHHDGVSRRRRRRGNDRSAPQRTTAATTGDAVARSNGGARQNRGAR